MQEIQDKIWTKKLPLTVRRKLQDIKPDNKSIEEFAELVQEMVTEGYPDVP